MAQLSERALHAIALTPLALEALGWVVLLGAISAIQDICPASLPSHCRATTGLAWYAMFLYAYSSQCCIHLHGNTVGRCQILPDARSTVASKHDLKRAMHPSKTQFTLADTADGPIQTIGPGKLACMHQARAALG